MCNEYHELTLALLDHDNRHGSLLSDLDCHGNHRQSGQPYSQRCKRPGGASATRMDLVAEGLSKQQIALRLGISPRTVENYRAWVVERMDAANVAELVRKVLIIKRGN